eukprot:scaffold334_cov356-Prasinococcus_capsulatus_cf.AAC.10
MGAGLLQATRWPYLAPELARGGRTSSAAAAAAPAPAPGDAPASTSGVGRRGRSDAARRAERCHQRYLRGREHLRVISHRAPSPGTPGYASPSHERGGAAWQSGQLLQAAMELALCCHACTEGAVATCLAKAQGTRESSCSAGGTLFSGRCGGACEGLSQLRDSVQGRCL